MILFVQNKAEEAELERHDLREYPVPHLLHQEATLNILQQERYLCTIFNLY